VSYSGHTTLAAAHALLEAGVGGSQLVSPPAPVLS